MVFSILIVSTLAIGSVEVTPQDGAPRAGKLLELSESSVRLSTEDGESTWPTEQLTQVTFSQDVESPKDAQVVAQLADGSMVRAASVETSETHVTFTMSSNTTITLPLRSMVWMRLQPIKEGDDQAWKSMTANQVPDDQIVIRRRDGKLQAVRGLIGATDAKQVRFKHDSQEWIDVDRDRVFGLTYFGGNNQVVLRERGRLTTTNGCDFSLAKMRLDTDTLKVTTVGGAEFSLPLRTIAKLDFASLSIDYLSDLEHDSVSISSFIAVPELKSLEATWFAPTQDTQLARQPLVAPIKGQVERYRKGLGIHGGTQLEYRLGKQYRQFSAIAAVPGSTEVGEVALTIRADGNEIFRETLRAGDDGVPVELNVTGVNRLQIAVEAGNRSDVGDHLSLCDAQLIK